MFIKKDLRKIDEILSDLSDTRESLKLSKRPAEFQGNVKILCQPTRITSLSNLKALNLYDNSLKSLEGIELLNQTPIEVLNAGCNKLESLPMKFGTIRTLKSVWLDDNQFETFPTELCPLINLEILRLSSNSIKLISPSISNLRCLTTLALDNNLLENFPLQVLELSHLKELWLRGNLIHDFPPNISNMISLEVLSLSSNKLRIIPDNIVSLTSLRKLYLNGNVIENVPTDLLPSSWTATWGVYDASTGLMTGKSADSSSSSSSSSNVDNDVAVVAVVCVQKKLPSVTLLGNPIVL
eukprot:gene9807-20397_t